ncbi:MAG: DUF2332 domain-containing protein [Pseudolysinimonas sp.]
MASDPSGTSDWYRRAADELAATSELQVEWALGVAADDAVVELIDRLPREHRQPSLVFSVANWLGAPAAGWPEFRSWLVEEWPRVEAAARTRRTQTNEVGRCAPLLAALDRIPGPLALLEVGASAGLCLGVDSFSYRFDDEAVLGEGEPVLACRTNGAGTAPTRLPEVVWRRGIDLAPLSIADEGDRAWLEALLPPDRPERLARLRAACETLAADPPEVIAGDALAGLAASAAAAPSGATLVIIALGTLVYLPPADRVAMPAAAAGLGARLVTMEPVGALPGAAARLATLTAPEPTPFVLALDGEPLAYASAHGDLLSWLTPVGQPDGGSAAS